MTAEKFNITPALDVMLEDMMRSAVRIFNARIAIEALEPKERDAVLRDMAAVQLRARVNPEEPPTMSEAPETETTTKAPSLPARRLKADSSGRITLAAASRIELYRKAQPMTHAEVKEAVQTSWPEFKDVPFSAATVSNLVLRKYARVHSRSDPGANGSTTYALTERGRKSAERDLTLAHARSLREPKK